MSKQLSYLPKLDALRAIAALMVLISHYLVEVNGPVFAIGPNGVQIFFVISGFLITSILLTQKKKAESRKMKLIGNFIIKRTLRLFPIYYMLLGFLVILKISGNLWFCPDGELWHYFTYTQNFLFLEHNFQNGIFDHTWSLAVEEQFYLLWPFLILLIPRKAELGVLIATILIGFLSRIYFVDYYHAQGTVKALTLIHFNTLGTGALLGYITVNGKEVVLIFLEKIADILFLITLGATLILYHYEKKDSFFLPLMITLMSFSVVYMCTRNYKSILDPLLRNRLLQQVGKISYGIYLYHKIVPFFFRFLYAKSGLAPIQNSIVLFIIYFAIAMGLALLSWKFIEAPILRYKEKFDL